VKTHLQLVVVVAVNGPVVVVLVAVNEPVSIRLTEHIRVFDVENL
jgi:hypothetical protein